MPKSKKPHIRIYTGMMCGYCVRALRLLDSKQVEYENIVVTMDPAQREKMIAAAGGRTSVPQIFIGGEHIGGCNELYALEASGALDVLLG